MKKGIYVFLSAVIMMAMCSPTTFAQKGNKAEKEFKKQQVKVKQSGRRLEHLNINLAKTALADTTGKLSVVLGGELFLRSGPSASKRAYNENTPEYLINQKKVDKKGSVGIEGDAIIITDSLFIKGRSRSYVEVSPDTITWAVSSKGKVKDVGIYYIEDQKTNVVVARFPISRLDGLKKDSIDLPFFFFSEYRLNPKIFGWDNGGLQFMMEVDSTVGGVLPPDIYSLATGKRGRDHHHQDPTKSIEDWEHLPTLNILVEKRTITTKIPKSSGKRSNSKKSGAPA